MRHAMQDHPDDKKEGLASAPGGNNGDAAMASASYRVAAAILSTKDGMSEIDGQKVGIVQGRIMGQDRVRSYFVGEVPVVKPPESFWTDRYLELPVFRPPALDPEGHTGIPHLNLDQVLDDAIGDLL